MQRLPRMEIVTLGQGRGGPQTSREKECEKMQTINSQESSLIEKLRALPPEQVAEVVRFVESLQHSGSDQKLSQACSRMSEDAFATVWDNAEDSVYDEL